MWYYWLIISGILFIGEIVTVGFLLFWFAIAALIAMIVSFFTSNIIIQTAVFLISSVILLFATKPLVNKIGKGESIKTNTSSLIGKKGIVIQEIKPTECTGQIKVGGEVWSAESAREIPIEKGTEIEILDIKGVKAVVDFAVSVSKV